MQLLTKTLRYFGYITRRREDMEILVVEGKVEVKRI